MKTFFELREGIETPINEEAENTARHLHFICYAAEEMIEWLEDGAEVEDWVGDKLAQVHARMQDLHSYMEGEKGIEDSGHDYEDEDDVKEEKYSPQKHEWGKPESTRFAKKMTPGEEVKEDDDPCWDSHKQVGMKKKNGKKVPNCVPK